MTGGVFSVSRKIWHHPIFKREKFTEREAFLWLISEASWRQRTVKSGRFVVDLERGQLCASVRFMAQAWGWTKSRVFRFLETLENQAMISTKSGTAQMVVTVCNYDDYQMGRDSYRDTRGTLAGHSRDTRGTNENTDKTEKTENNAREARAERFQEFWDTYPHRNGKKDKRATCEAMYAKAVKSGVAEAVILAAAAKYRDDGDVRRGYGRAASTWLRGRGWDDEVAQDTRTWRDKPESEWTARDRIEERERWL